MVVHVTGITQSDCVYNWMPFSYVPMGNDCIHTVL